MRKARPSEPTETSVSPEYQVQVVTWYLSSGKTIAEAAASLNLSESTLREWVWYTSLDDAPGWPAQPPVAQASEMASTDTDGVSRRADRAGAESPSSRTDRKLAEALARADALAEAEASAHAEAAVAREEARAAYAAAVEAMIRTEVAAAEAIAQARSAARTEIAAVYAAAVEAVLRAEVAADGRAAKAEAAAAEAVATANEEAQNETVSRLKAEAAAREEAATAYASAMEVVVRAEDLASEAMAHSRAVPAHLAQPEIRAIQASEMALAAKALKIKRGAGEPTNDEAAARAEIAHLVSRFEPVELWVHATGRTLAEASVAALEQLGVDESEAEFEVLSDRSRWIHGRVQLRARVRSEESVRP